jgi:hypothetical protein
MRGSPVISSVIAFLGGLTEKHGQGAMKYASLVSDCRRSSLDHLQLTLSVVRSSAGRVNQSTGNSGNQETVRDLELESVVELLTGRGEHAVELFSLDDRSGESIEDESARSRRKPPVSLSEASM